MTDSETRKIDFVRRRKELNLTQEDIAKALNISTRSISSWESGQHLPRLTPRQTAIFCDLLQMSVHELAELFEPACASPQN
ncbi:MAG: helix-turn-helix transcriptional regulator [Cyanobacteria bacterium P01_D01_bin.44]